jgi:RNA polymerase sigma-70 factor (ECF subfamily)
VDDEELVWQVLDGNRGAFTSLVERYTSSVYGLCVARVRRRDVVPDLVQETFSRAWVKLHTLQGQFSTWLHGIARNVCNAYIEDLCRRQRGNQELWDRQRGNRRPDPQSDPFAPDDPLRDDVQRLMAEVHQLPWSLRLPLVMRYLEPSSTFQQIADRLKTTPAAIRQRLARARNRLRRRLRGPACLCSHHRSEHRKESSECKRCRCPQYQPQRLW